MSEPVRLVVWDLDGTFWAGTVTEGGFTYCEDNHNIVIELARRGIVSSICSKNDYDTIKAILEARGIWDYFVFPSIDWNPKGPRLKQMVEDFKLRPASVLLLDDNSLNLEEAKYFVPGIQTADHKFIPEILRSSLFEGKNDHELTRLKQYRLLEVRKSDESTASDNIEFLQSCNITVGIDMDVEAHIDRAVELINRTNQLNFTKRRLPDDPKAARKVLLDQLRSYNVQAGLIRVKDRYGDYGHCGFYLVRTSRGGRATAHQFCFSCRILNMGVESWVFERLGRPRLKGVDGVPLELQSDSKVHWISIEQQRDNGAGSSTKEIWPGRVFIRGACTVSPLAHYFGIVAREVIGEFHEFRGFMQIRRDHSLMLQYGIQGCSKDQLEILLPLGYKDEYFDTAFSETSNEPTLRILCNWADSQRIVYRHKKSGLLVPYKMKRLRRSNAKGRFDPIALSEGDDDLQIVSEEGMAAMRYLRKEFDHVGQMPEAAAAIALDVIFNALPSGSALFIVAAPEDSTHGVTLDDAARINTQTQSVAARHPDKSINLISLNEFASEGERQTEQHFDRTVYFRLYREIWNRFRKTELQFMHRSNDRNKKNADLHGAFPAL